MDADEVSSLLGDQVSAPLKVQERVYLAECGHSI
jgi:hypothetical protein